MIMPGGWTGRELATRILAENSAIKVIYTTGYSPDTFSADLPLEEGLNFLAKPYPPNKLLETVRRCLDEAAPAC
jgi:DNA-binding NtrC family response regulator